MDADTQSTMHSQFTATDSTTDDLLYTQTTDTFIQLMTSPTASVDTLSCSQHQVPCDASIHGIVRHCLHGLCCWNTALNDSGCKCADGFTGQSCQLKIIAVDIDDLDDLTALESRGKSMFMMSGISAMISLAIGLLALAAVIAFIVRRRKQLPKECLQRHLSEINDELDRLPSIDKLVQLTRLTKLFEASTIAAAKTAVLYVTDETTKEPRRLQVLSATYTQCLPRWSSAPSILDTHSQPGDEVDNGFIETHDKRKLQVVFSVDESRVHYQQQDTRL